mmetsp:Transcript_48786/g.122180  ORF Transcript_48786/g.122180 Transcript_48786/m.122180 type:complete len:100 (+) Transcript_48786:563-862(+)
MACFACIHSCSQPFVQPTNERTSVALVNGWTDGWMDFFILVRFTPLSLLGSVRVCGTFCVHTRFFFSHLTDTAPPLCLPLSVWCGCLACVVVYLFLDAE